MKKAIAIFSLFILLAFGVFAGNRTVDIQSPDKLITLTISLREKIYLDVHFKSQSFLLPAPVSLTLANGFLLGADPVLKKQTSVSINSTIRDVINYKKSVIPDVYNELTLSFKGDYSLIVRVYEEGWAYRFTTNLPGEIVVKVEENIYRFNQDYPIYYIPKKTINNDGEGSYLHTPISKIPDSVFSLMPFLVEVNDSLKIAITESDLLDYPGMSFQHHPENTYVLQAVFPKRADKTSAKGWEYKIETRKDFISNTGGSRSFPWRVMVIAGKDIELADCDLVYKLATPTKIKDVSWIKPGKVAWDWWYDWNIEGVDFKAEQGSFEFYKWVADFSSSHGIEYMEVSVGWNKDEDILAVNPNIHMKELVEYAASKNVKVLVWVVASTLERQYDKAFQLFTYLGVAGIKVDFMNSDDQGRIQLYERIAKDCAARKLIVYYHGACKPTGLERTYPNIINYESVQGNENNKRVPVVTPGYCLNLAFIRNLAGPMDFTPGAMKNATKDNFRASNSEPMSQGTRCMQLSEYIIYFSPIQMLCDAPSNYLKEKDCLEFIASVPTTWDESQVLGGAIGKYIVTARRKGNNWFVGGMANWDGKIIDLDLSFLGKGKWIADTYMDGPNANRKATDFLRKNIWVTNQSNIKINMMEGSGFVMKISRSDK